MAIKKETKKVVRKAAAKKNAKSDVKKVEKSAPKFSLNLTKKAGEKLLAFLKKEKLEKSFVRVFAVSGCCGLNYSMDVDKKKGADDILFESQGVKLVVEKSMKDMVNGITIDFVKTEHTEGFRIDNPKDFHDHHKEKSCGDSCNCC